MFTLCSSIGQFIGGTSWPCVVFLILIGAITIVIVVVSGSVALLIVAAFVFVIWVGVVFPVGIASLLSIFYRDLFGGISGLIFSVPIAAS